MIPYYLFIIMMFSIVLLIHTKRKNLSTVSIIFKALTSLFFIGICVSSQYLHRGGHFYFYFILTALILSFLGDVLLAFPIDIARGVNRNFIAGLLSFALAHIFFSISFITMTSLTIKDLLLFLIIASALLITLKLIKGFNYNGMFPFVVLYLLIISFMVAKALSVLSMLTFNFGALLIVIGAILFFISDIILSFIYFHSKNFKKLVPLNLITYYIGQALIALSVLYF